MDYKDEHLTKSRICDKFSVRYDQMNKQLRSKIYGEDEKSFFIHPNIRVPVWLVEDTCTSKNNSVIDKEKLYQNFTTVTDPELSRTYVAKYQGIKMKKI